MCKRSCGYYCLAVSLDLDPKTKDVINPKMSKYILYQIFRNSK